MGRTCCVFNCTSKRDTPSHKFPKDLQLREKWLRNLIIKPYKETEVCNLRVCYKHFEESDSNGSSILRRLTRSAIPSMMETDTCITQINNIVHHYDKSIQQHQEAITVSQSSERHTQSSQGLSQSSQGLAQSSKGLTQSSQGFTYSSKINIENFFQMQKSLEELSQKQAQDHDQLQEMVEEMTSIKTQLYQLQTRRFNWTEIMQRKNLSPIELKLYDNIIKLRSQKRRMKRIINRIKQENKIKKIIFNGKKYKDQEDRTIKVQKNLVNMILKNNNVVPQARQCSLEEKMFCFGSYCRFRSCYNFISKFLSCPSYNTLNMQLKSIPIDTGCNKIILKYLTLTAKNIDSKDLNVVLAWKKMSLQPGLTYDVKNDKIVGFEDWGGMRRTRRFADHAILFHIKCLASGQKMPIGYGFCKSGTSFIHLSRFIKRWLIFLQRCGFKPKATVCDQRGSNIAAITSLIQETCAPYFRHNKLQMENIFFVGQECIVALYDYVDLQKGVRNNLLEKDLLLAKNAKLSERENQCASWDHIKTAYEIDQKCFENRRKMNRLTDNHIYPDLIPKMKAKYAVQVLSHTVADFMDIILSLNQGTVKTNHATMTLSKNGTATREALYFFNDLFDSFNGNINQGLSSIITQNSGHLKFWRKALQILNNMEFVEKRSYKSLRRNKPRCLYNWRRTLRSAQYLWEMLQDSGFTKLNLKYLNQDDTEIFFTKFRGHGQQKNNPTPYLFGMSFKALLTCNLTSKHFISSNYREDETRCLPLSTVMRTEEIESTESNETTVKSEEAAIPKTADMARIFYINTNNIINIVKKIKVNCAQCTEILEDKKVTKMLEHVIKIAEQRFYTFCHKTEIKSKLIKILNEETWFTVHFHCTYVCDIVINTLAHYFIMEWCDLINKILQGKMKCELKHDYMYFQAHRMSLKYCRKKVPSRKAK